MKFRLMVAAAVFLVGFAAWYSIKNKDPNPLASPACPKDTLASQFKAADLIIRGHVFLVAPGPTGADVVIVPERRYKGQLQRASVTLAAVAAGPNQDRREGSDELLFSSKKPGPYLLFLRQRQDGRYSTRRCYGSKFLETELSESEKQILGQGSEI